MDEVEISHQKLAAEVKSAAEILNDTACKATDDHVEGPFYRPGAPDLTDIYPTDSHGSILYFEGSIVDTDCKRLSATTIEIWHADDLGHYDNDDPGHPPAPGFFRCRARIKATFDGQFKIRAVLPANYKPDPSQAWVRVKHLHFKFFGESMQPLTTEIALLPDGYTATDVLYNPNLAAALEESSEENNRRVFRAVFNFVLRKISSTGYVLAAARTLRTAR